MSEFEKPRRRMNSKQPKALEALFGSSKEEMAAAIVYAERCELIRRQYAFTLKDLPNASLELSKLDQELESAETKNVSKSPPSRSSLDRAIGSIVRNMQDIHNGNSAIKEMLRHPELLPIDHTCSISWSVACDLFRVKTTSFSSARSRCFKPIPQALKDQLNDTQLKQIHTVTWNGKPHIVVLLASMQQPLFIGEKLQAEKIFMLSLLDQSLLV